MKYQVQENCLTIFLPNELEKQRFIGHKAQKIGAKFDK